MIINSTKVMQHPSGRGSHQTIILKHNSSTRGGRQVIMKMLLLFGFLMSNSILICQAMPHPKSAPKDDFRPNFATMYGAPLISPLMEDVILEVNTNYTLRCEANDEIVWKLPNIFGIPTELYEVKSFNTLDPERPYGSMLYLMQVQKENVGSYYCIKASKLEKDINEMEEEEVEELVNNNDASSIYIYVNDLNNLLVPFEFPVGYAHQYQDFTIPCKPTVPTVEVLLTTPIGEDLDDVQIISTSSISTQTEVFPPDNVYSSIAYNPRVGFIIHNVINITTYFGCIGQKGPHNRTEEYRVEFLRRYDPRRGFVVQMRGVADGGMYWCRPKTPSPNNEEESVVIDIEFRGNEHVDLLGMAFTMESIKPSKTEMVTVEVIDNVNDTKNPSNILINRQQSVDFESIVVNKTVNESSDLFGVFGIFENNNNSNNNNINNNVTNDKWETFLSNRNDDGVDDDAIFTPNNATNEYNKDGYGYFEENRGESVSDDNENEADDYGNGEGSLRSFDESQHFSSTHSRRSVNKRDLATTDRPTSSPNKFRNTPRRPHTTHVNKPQITSASRGHAIEGENFQLVCEVKIAHDVSYTTEWITPPGVEEARMIKKGAEFHNKTMTHTFGRAVLTVIDARKTDSGNYKCIVTDHSNNRAYNTYLMTILKKNESYINISEPNDYYDIREKAGKTVQINVKYRGFPPPTLTWYKPDGTEIQPTAKYLINVTDTSIMLKILNSLMTDSGEYVLRAANGFIEKELRFNVSISGVPIASMEDVYVQAGQEAHLVCSVLSYPTATVTWVFRPCSIQPRWPSCDSRMEQTFNSSKMPKAGASSIEYIYDLYFKPSSPGIAHCVAVNKIDRTEGKAHVLIGDIAENMTVYGVDESQKIARGDDVIITCAALAYYYAEDLEWFKDGEMISEGNGIELIKDQTAYSYKKSLKFNNIRDADRGTYECRAEDANQPGQSDSKYISIFVHEPTAPKMLQTNMDSSSKMDRKLGDSLELECKSEAIPRADVTWYKDDVQLKTNENIAMEENHTKLVIPFIKPEDEGVYKCVVANRLGMTEASVTVKITNMPGLKLGWILGILFFFVVLIGLVIYLCVRVNRERKLLRELKAAGLANFEEGAVEHINPALTLDEQADLLPYDRRFEFPRHKLKLGKQLGAGAFGVVLKAHAEGIKPDEKETVVAVKMVKRTADNEVMKALVSELKIMVHLGQHLNVVNLLGAVTENIAKREVMVIVEFCRYGNVQNFLLRNRKRFINQINPETGKIDPSIVTQRFSDNFELNRDGLKYVNVGFSNHQYINHMNNMNNNYSLNNRRNTDNDPRSGTRSGRPNSSGYVRESELYDGQIDSCATENTLMTTISENEDNILSNNSAQPAWRSNYKPDSTEAMTITTSDLVSWAFQVARGMDYLAARKVLHGDLAARNILLCEDNVVKICDFGLARSMYKSENYKKQGEARLPIKWLALESLSDHVFSTYTDIWSFGIVLWEFFSLAKVPYPGMDANQSLYLKLKDGYRMEKPPYANNELYDIMLECWSTNPECRPLFHVLEQKFARLLGDDVTNHYLELNNTYLRANDEYFKRTETDYLALMGSPDEIAPPPPRYVNGRILPEIRIEASSDDYIQMKSGTTTIFSPTRPKDSYQSNDNSTTTTSFTFPDNPTQQHSPTLANNLNSPVNKTHQKEIIEPEEMPMLQTTTKYDQDEDQDYTEENSSHKYGKPSSAMTSISTPKLSRSTPKASPRNQIGDTQLTGEDNYVNLKSTKKNLNNNGATIIPDAYYNPSYQMLKTANENVK